MTPDGSAVGANLSATYLALGRAIPGAVVEEHPGVTICHSPFQHPVGNFAIATKPNESSARTMARTALERGVFNVYLLPDRPSGADETMARAGFSASYSLVAMSAERLGDCAPPAEPCPDSDKEEVVQFLMDIFFGSQSRAVRAGVGRATSAAEGLRFFAWRRGSRLVAAAMAMEWAGVVGVYNLCVAPHARGGGVGTKVLLALQSYAARAGLATILQCDTSLEGWYLDRGYRNVGRIDVLGLAMPRSTVIM